jgi:hypothetical protein
MKRDDDDGWSEPYSDVSLAAQWNGLVFHPDETPGIFVEDYWASEFETASTKA